MRGWRRSAGPRGTQANDASCEATEATAPATAEAAPTTATALMSPLILKRAPIDWNQED